MKYINQEFRDTSSEYHFYNYYENLGDNFRKGITKFVNPLFSSTWSDWDGALLGSFAGGDDGVLVPVINSSESLYGFGLNASVSDYERPPKIFKYNHSK